MKSGRKKVLCVIGTRPEAIKMAPVIACLHKSCKLQALVCVTSQHEEMLEEALDVFSIRPDWDLRIMRHNQSPDDVAHAVLERLCPLLRQIGADCVLVQGDTTTAFAAALAAFYTSIPVGHVEAGLRTYRCDAPYPEEINRQMISRMAAIHFAPTGRAARNLVSEGIPRRLVHVTGNTVIDSLRMALSGELPPGELSAAVAAAVSEPGKKLVLVTAHRRENFKRGIRNICLAAGCLARRDDVAVAFPVHPNPNIAGRVNAMLGRRKNVFLLRPQPYPAFVRLMQASRLIITDSGGIQEEAAYLGKPVLVTREATERGEGVSARAALLAGTRAAAITAAAAKILDAAPARFATRRAGKIYGDGHSAPAIVRILEGLLCK